MSTFKRYNPVLKNKLNHCVQRKDAELLLSTLQSLSVSDFRTAGYMLAEEILPTLSNDDYWSFFLTIVPYHAKAYLGTFLKAAHKLYVKGVLNMSEQSLQLFSQQCSSIDRGKTLTALLPLAKTYQEIEMLIRTFCHNQLSIASAFLIKAQSIPCYYQLFMMLKMADPQDIRAIALSVLRVGDARAYRMTSILKAYFDISDLPVQLSFRVQDYELNRLDQGYEQFKKMMMQ